MKKKLTRDSFSALRETAIVLDEQEQRAVKGGDYFDDHGYYTTDSSGNITWTRTVNDSSSGSYSSGSGGYGSSSGSGWISQDAYFNWSGTWTGGYVDGLGYVGADVNIYGSGSGDYNSSSGGGNFNLNNALDYLTSNANSSSIGSCAKYVRLALEAGGLNTDGRPGSAAGYDTYLPTIGFSVISTSNYTPQAGDIIVHEATDNHPHGHIAMYNGQQWISDFVQRDMFGGSAYRDASNYTILRWNP